MKELRGLKRSEWERRACDLNPTVMEKRVREDVTTAAGARRIL